jgi:hypothetical protein
MNRLKRRLISAIVALGVMSPAAVMAEAPPRVAVFDFELIDTSLEGEVSGVRADQQKRLAMISDQLRDLLAKSGRYVVVDHSPATDRIEAAGYLRGCNGCEAEIARDLGADLAMTGTVQKVSNLILNINLYVRDAASGERLRSMSVDIRGNTDQSWSRGLSYLVRNRLLSE